MCLCVCADVFGKDQLYIVFVADNSGNQLGSYVVRHGSQW